MSQKVRFGTKTSFNADVTWIEEENSGRDGGARRRRGLTFTVWE